MLPQPQITCPYCKNASSGGFLVDTSDDSPASGLLGIAPVGNVPDSSGSAIPSGTYAGQMPTYRDVTCLKCGRKFRIDADYL